jgi:CCR4-NOT transcription complex subunit 1
MRWGGSVAAAPVAADGTRASLTSLTLTTLLDAAPALVQAPSEGVEDRVHFIVNNVATTNIDAKVAELRTLLAPELYGWFAQYLVVKRASIEPNYHTLYVLLVDTFRSPALGLSAAKAHSD